ncbi:MAG: hypothetical protein QM715_06945 [Nibricoccus sp.]
MKNVAHLGFNLIMLLGLLLCASPASAKDVPVDAKSVVGHWVLVDFRGGDPQARPIVLATKLEMTFHADRTASVRARHPEDGGKVETRKGNYTVENGKIAMKLEGETAEEPARAVIRDGKLVLLPADSTGGELIFTKSGK